MIEISREEFVKRYNERLNCLIDGEEYDDFKRLGCVLLDCEGWERIKTLIENLHNGLELD